MESWLQITIRLPVIIAIILAIFIVGGVFLGIVLLRRYQKNLSELSDEKENLRNLRGDFEVLETRSHDDRQAYENFVQNISHEVSNPLQSVQTNLDNMAHSSPDDPERWKRYYEIISSDIRRLATLTERLRAFSRLETSDRLITREAVNLKGVIETVIISQSDYAEEQKVRLRYHGSERLARVLGNRDSLEQVFLNLVGNSIKYSKEGGGEVIISVLEDNELMHVRVMDDGIGIPEEDLNHIFALTFRSPDTFHSQRKGTGLGLAIVKRIVEQHGGQIQITSQLGKGTTVSFVLPKYIPSSN